MRIDLHCENVEAAPGLHEYVARRMRFAIGRFHDHIRWARVKVADVNGPRGGADKRCVVQLRLRNLPDVVFAITQLDVRAAVDEAAERVSRVLAQRLRRQRKPERLALGGGLPTPA
ncbi:MAG: HPF/RaiA family ribosome-associated protein [Thauera sp.]|nr:HPF/RaiA family ribosome-associated protein [Thauera sp.]